MSEHAQRTLVAVVVVAAVLGLGVLALGLWGAGDDEAPPAAAPAREVRAAGSSLAIGGVSIDVGEPRVAGDRRSVTVAVALANAGPAPVVFSGSQQGLVTDAGTYRAAEAVTGLRAGESASTELTFRIPAGAAPTALALAVGGRTATLDLAA